MKSIVLNMVGLLFSPCAVNASEGINISHLNIGSGDWCPHVCNPSENNGRQGYISDTVLHALNQLNINAQVTHLNYARALTMAERGELNGIMAVIEEESNGLLFNRSPLGYSQNYFYAAHDSDWTYNGKNSLYSVRLGAVNGYDYLDTHLNFYIRKYRNQNVTIVNGNSPQKRLIKLLMLGRIDTFLDDYLVVQHALGSNAELPLKVVGKTRGALPIYLGLAPDFPEAENFLIHFDQQIEKMKKDGSYARILGRYKGLFR